MKNWKIWPLWAEFQVSNNHQRQEGAAPVDGPWFSPARLLVSLPLWVPAWPPSVSSEKKTRKRQGFGLRSKYHTCEAKPVKNELCWEMSILDLQRSLPILHKKYSHVVSTPVNHQNTSAFPKSTEFTELTLFAFAYNPIMYGEPSFPQRSL